MTENLCVLCFKHDIVYEMEDFFIYQSNNLLIGNELFILIFFSYCFFEELGFTSEMVLTKKCYLLFLHEKI